MTFSPLISGVLPHHGKHRGKGPVNRIVVHHWAGTRGGDTRLTDPKAKASATYILYANGALKGQVPEEYRPWTSGPTGDVGSVTVETQNSSGAPRWGISAASAEKLAQLMADLSNRYGWGELKRGTNVRVHKDFANTACPGPSMLAQLPGIIARANQLRKGKPAAPKPSGGTHTVVKGETLSKIASKYGTTWQKLQELNKLANPNVIKVGQKVRVPGVTAPTPKRDIALEVYQGKWGNGADRTNRLRAAGHNPKTVQAEVNRRWYS